MVPRIRRGRVLCPQCATHYRRKEIIDTDDHGRRWQAPREAGAVREIVAVLTRDHQWLADRARRRGLARDRAGVIARCPKGHPLPAGFVDRPTVVIGLIGPSAVSKSTYLGVLVQRLVNHADLRDLDLTFSLDDLRSRDMFTWLYNVPLEQGRPPEPTPAREPRDPLVVRMQGHGRDVNLFFFDAAGESQARHRDNAHLNTFLTVMDAALVFWTPAALELPPALRLPPGTEPGVAPGPHRVIQVVTTVAANRSVDAGRRDIPVAGVLAKCDEITGLLTDQAGNPLGQLDLDAGFLADPQSALDAQGEVPYRITDTFAPGIIQAVEAFSGRRSFHAVSATGHQPSADMRFPRISPTRVHEPLLAILHGLGLLERGTR